eukprot:Opistho-1_new@48017
MTYDKSNGRGFETVFNCGFTASRYGQITMPSLALTATLQSIAELSAQIGIGIGPARVDFFGPYFRLIPGVALTLSPQTYEAKFFVNAKAGIKGPDWQVLWFKLSLEWGYAFKLYEVLLESGTWNAFKYTQYVAAKLFDSAPAALTDLALAAGLQMDSTPPPQIGGGVQVDYVVTTYTGTLDNAGTDADVYVQLYCGDGTVSDKIWLDTSNDDFEKGDIDTFLVKGPACAASAIARVKVGHDNTGLGPDWYLEKLTVTAGGTRYTAVARQWLKAADGSAAVALLPALTDADYASGLYRVEIETLLTPRRRRRVVADHGHGQRRRRVRGRHGHPDGHDVQAGQQDGRRRVRGARRCGPRGNRVARPADGRQERVRQRRGSPLVRGPRRRDGARRHQDAVCAARLHQHGRRLDGRVPARHRGRVQRPRVQLLGQGRAGRVRRVGRRHGRQGRHEAVRAHDLRPRRVHHAFGRLQDAVRHDRHQGHRRAL